MHALVAKEKKYEKKAIKKNNLKDDVWNKAKIIPGTDSSKYRRDICGNKIFYDYYRLNKIMGWYEKIQQIAINKNTNDHDSYDPHISMHSNNILFLLNYLSLSASLFDLQF
jgi:hypothetical protein